MSADGGHARPEDVLLDQQAFAALAEEADQPDPQKLTSAIQSLPDKELDALVKKAGGPIMLKDEQGLPMIVPNDDGQDSYVWYLGGGKVRLVTIAGMGGPGGPARPTTSGTPPNAGSGVDSLIRP